MNETFVLTVRQSQMSLSNMRNLAQEYQNASVLIPRRRKLSDGHFEMRFLFQQDLSLWTELHRHCSAFSFSSVWCSQDCNFNFRQC